jgi:hypothetical protein
MFDSVAPCFPHKEFWGYVWRCRAVLLECISQGAYPNVTDGHADQVSWLQIFTRALTHRWCEVLGTRTYGVLGSPQCEVQDCPSFRFAASDFSDLGRNFRSRDSEPTLMNGGSPVIKTERWPAVLEKEQTRFLLHSHGKVFPHPTRASRSSSDPLIRSWTGAR